MRALLSETRLLEGCTSQELEDIEKISQSVIFNKGDVIFTAGSPADHLYIVTKGTVELRFSVAYYLARKEVALDRKHKGEVFGWSTLTRPYFYTAEAVAVEDSELIQLKGEDIKRLQADNIHLGYLLMHNIAQIIAERLNAVQRMLVGEIQHELRQREFNR